MIIETARLLMRPFTDDDADALAAINTNPASTRYFPAPMTRADSNAALKRYQQGVADNGFSFLAAELKPERQLIGIVGISRLEAPVSVCIPGSPEVEIGWRISPEAWGHGYAPEAAQACLKYGFETLNLPEIVAITFEGNLPSRRVMEKIGMRHDPQASFDHPKVPADSPVKTHVTYRMANPAH